MNASAIATTTVGIVATVIVSWVTYHLSVRVTRRNQWQSAKETILRDLSRSLGEGTVPSPEIIVSTMRSVLRNQGAINLEVITLEEIVDDLIWQVTSDPFLDSARRTQLQSELLGVTQAYHELKSKQIPQTLQRRSLSSTPDLIRSVTPVFLSLIAGLSSLALFFYLLIPLASKSSTSGSLHSNSNTIYLIFIAAIIFSLMGFLPAALILFVRNVNRAIGSLRRPRRRTPG